MSRFKDTSHKCFGSPFTKVGVCLKQCENRDKKCDVCIRFSELKLKNAEITYKKDRKTDRKD